MIDVVAVIQRVSRVISHKRQKLVLHGDAAAIPDIVVNAWVDDLRHHHLQSELVFWNGHQALVQRVIAVAPAMDIACAPINR